LARALGIPWIAVFDGDDAGQNYLRGISNRNFPAEFITDRCATLPAGNLEQQLLSDGFEPELRSILTQLGHADAAQISRDDLRARMDKVKMACAAALAARIASDANLAQRMPAAFRNAIMRLRGLQA
jgi:putative ATP-dependent endonuclease of OLD family